MSNIAFNILAKTMEQKLSSVLKIPIGESVTVLGEKKGIKLFETTNLFFTDIVTLVTENGTKMYLTNKDNVKKEPIQHNNGYSNPEEWTFPTRFSSSASFGEEIINNSNNDKTNELNLTKPYGNDEKINYYGKKINENGSYNTESNFAQFNTDNRETGENLIVGKSNTDGNDVTKMSDMFAPYKYLEADYFATLMKDNNGYTKLFEQNTNVTNSFPQFTEQHATFVNNDEKKPIFDIRNFENNKTLLQQKFYIIPNIPNFTQMFNNPIATQKIWEIRKDVPNLTSSTRNQQQILSNNGNFASPFLNTTIEPDKPMRTIDTNVTFASPFLNSTIEPDKPTQTCTVNMNTLVEPNTSPQILDDVVVVDENGNEEINEISLNDDVLTPANNDDVLTPANNYDVKIGESLDNNVTTQTDNNNVTTPTNNRDVMTPTDNVIMQCDNHNIITPTDNCDVIRPTDNCDVIRPTDNYNVKTTQTDNYDINTTSTNNHISQNPFNMAKNYFKNLLLQDDDNESVTSTSSSDTSSTNTSYNTTSSNESNNSSSSESRSSSNESHGSMPQLILENDNIFTIKNITFNYHGMPVKTECEQTIKVKNGMNIIVSKNAIVYIETSENKWSKMQLLDDCLCMFKHYKVKY